MSFADFFNNVFGGLGNLLGQIIQFLQALVQSLQVVLQFIWDNLRAVFGYAVKALRNVAGFFKHLWESFYKNIFTRVLTALRDAHRWLEAHLLPVIRWLQRARAMLDRWYRLYLRPYLQMLQRIRGYLQVLRLLHIRWAEALDRRLSRTEAQLAHQFILVRGTLNDVINFVNGIADPRRLSRMVLVSMAGRRTAAAIVRAVTGLPLGFFFPHTGKGALPFEQPVTKASDLRDPRRNPPVSDLLGGALLPLPDAFESSDPAPDLGELDGLETVPYFDALSASLDFSELALQAIPDLPVSLLDAITDGTGLLGDAARPAVTAVS